MSDKKILLSFDVEEFDMPLEYNIDISPKDQLNIGFEGFKKIEELLTIHRISTTLFTTAHFANNYSNEIKNAATHHEIASHTYYHSDYKTEHLLASRIALEKITNTNVTGLRMPRMKQIPIQDILEAGYNYDSSINPTWLPGRYNNLNKPRTFYTENNMLRIPASVSSLIRFPLFWLSFKNLPLSVYVNMLKGALKKDGYLCIYFHPWEFTNIEQYAMPKYTRNPCGEILLEKMDRLIKILKDEGDFCTMQEFIRSKIKVT
jgi:hypothetical protein